MGFRRSDIAHDECNVAGCFEHSHFAASALRGRGMGMESLAIGLLEQGQRNQGIAFL
jgi:hypothetical protein